MKAEIFDALSWEEKRKHLSEVAGLASYEKYSKTASTKKTRKRDGESMPGRNADFQVPIDTGLFEEE